MEKNINGEIMLENRVVAKVQNNALTFFDSNLAPLFAEHRGDVKEWLKNRAIDSHRTNSRLLKKILRLKEHDDISTVLSVHAVSLTDRYWFRETGETLCWDDVRFKENLFADLALKGDSASFNIKPSLTPELTNTGSYEKCWKNINGEWWLYKAGNQKERFSELFVYKLGDMLGFPMAVYEADGDYVRSKDFTNNASVNLEPICSIVGDDEDYNRSFNVCRAISEDVAKDYLKMIYLDTLCFNRDRHTKNYGFLRDINTGAILSLAPNYDNNLSLIANDCPDVSRINDGLIRFFSDFINSNETAAKMLTEMNIHKVSVSDIENIISSIPIKVDAVYIKDFILNGQEKIEEIVKDAAHKSLDEILEAYKENDVLTKYDVGGEER